MVKNSFKSFLIFLFCINLIMPECLPAGDGIPACKASVHTAGDILLPGNYTGNGNIKNNKASRNNKADVKATDNRNIKEDKNNRQNGSRDKKKQKRTPVTLSISTGQNERTSIQDPSKASGNVKNTLAKPLARGWGSIKRKQRKNYFTDLSFAGFKGKVFVPIYAIGPVTKKDTRISHIYNTDTGKVTKEKGRCLVLYVIEGVSAKKSSLYIKNCNRNSFLILDYANGTYYKTKTSFFWSDIFSFNFVDMTGDAQNELFIELCYNTWYETETYRFDAGQHKAKRLYTSWDKDLSKLLSCQIEDNYKVSMEYKDIGYSKKISLLELGYRKKDLEAKNAKKYEYYGAECLRLYNNGKLIKKRADDTTILSSRVPMSVSIEQEPGEKPCMKIMTYVMLCIREHILGNMYSYYQYDEKLDALVLVKAKFKKNI